MSDRLKELQRQRALMQEHLAWLDREIAKETGVRTDVVPLRESKTASIATTASSTATPPQAAADILAQYSQEAPGSMAKDAKRGCIISFVAVFALLALGVTAFYLLWKR